MGQLDGKVAVITGAGSGMGRASTDLFVAEGARVLAADISGREQETAEANGDAVVPFHVDVSNEDEVAAMFAAAVDAFGKVDIVCNVAGIGGAGYVADIELEEYERIMAVDLRGVVLGIKHGVKTMLPTGGGTIVNWSSIGGLNASVFPTSIYSAAKAGVVSFTKATAVEYGAQGIRCNAVAPGFVETELTGGKGSAERFPDVVGGCPMKRAGQPEEVAQLALFLASDASSYVNGVTVPIDGGVMSTLA